MGEDIAIPEDRDALAAELALGLLDGEARAEALRLRLSDRDFAQAVDAWGERLGPLFDDVQNMVPPVRVWTAIEARMGMTAKPADDTIKALRRWRAGALLSGAVAASLAFVILRPQSQTAIPQASKAMVVAQMIASDGPAVMTAAYDPVSGKLRLNSVAMPESTKSPELWVIPADGVPRSLGLVGARGGSAMQVAVAHRKLMADGATLAITMEERAGAPHAAPTGAPILAGKISTI